MRKLVLAVVLAAGCGEARPDLHVLNWSDYFAPDTIAKFEKEFGCTVKLDYLESSEGLRTKLETVPSGYDVVFPSDEILPLLISRGLLERLDASKLPNLANLDAKWRGLPFDPKNEWSVPYLWGTTGIAYNQKRIDPPPDSWAALWDPKFADHATMLDDPREAFAAAMFLNGDDVDTPTAESIARAAAKLKAQKLLAYTSSPKDKLVAGDAWIAHCFSGDALQAADAKERAADIAFVIPKEGGITWVDNMAIARSAPQADLAHAFINHLLRPDVSAAISNEVWYANPNAAAQKHIDPKVLTHPITHPDEATLKRCRLLREPSPELKRKLLDAWAEVRAR